MVAIGTTGNNAKNLCEGNLRSIVEADKTTNSAEGSRNRRDRLGATELWSEMYLHKGGTSVKALLWIVACLLELLQGGPMPCAESAATPLTVMSPRAAMGKISLLFELITSRKPELVYGFQFRSRPTWVRFP
jgi:hypothetical protein